MINSAKIVDAICEKIKFVAGDEILLEEEFEKQLAEIKNNFNEATKTTVESIKNKNLLRYLTDLNYTDWDRFRESNKLFKQYYKRTGSFLETKL